MAKWLLDRLFDAGSQPTPRFALQGTVNWMRALAEVVNSGTCNDSNLEHLYCNVQRRKVNIQADNLVFENIHMSFNNLASLKALRNSNIPKYDICSNAIVSWYYTVYFACSGMIAAASGLKQQTHAATAKVWQADVVEKQLIPSPFNFYVDNLTKSSLETRISFYRGENRYSLTDRAGGLEVAHGGILSYLKGTCEYKKWQIEERIKSSKEFKQLEVTNFRTKAARELRDEKLKKEHVNFLGEAFRYRGKAHYRDSIFLSYGDNNLELIEQLLVDLCIVAEAFLHTASYYCSARVEKGSWANLVTDIENNTRLSLDVKVLKSN